MVELLIATSIMAIIAGALGTLAMSVQVGNQHSFSQSTITQHGRVVMDRIQRTLNGATANENFPGFAVFSESVGPWEFPDTIVVWNPSGQAADPAGLPRVNELVIFCPDPASPTQLVEIRIPGDTQPVPPLSDVAAWQTSLSWAKTTNTAQRVVLTDMVRAPAVGSQPRGAVRFQAVQRPSDAQLQAYRSASLAWEDVAWVQDVYSSNTGLRQNWCRIELQLVPPVMGRQPIASETIPFFGSAAVYYQVVK